MREVRVLGGKYNGIVYCVDDLVEKINITKVEHEFPIRFSDDMSRMITTESEEYTILRLWSGEWICVKL
ncbi:conserved hypothetical protein [Vibrio phage 120E34-1]|nr:conserved hypothetical protein [Vibrio phage 120E34-1]